MPMELKRRAFERVEQRESDGEEEIDPTAHAKLVDGINKLTGSHFIRDVTRTEPALKRSEFGLAKTQNDKVHLGDLEKFFNKTKKHTEVVKQLVNIKSRAALETPLEKPVADRIERKAGYERVQTELEQWTPVVTATQVAPQIVYPLQYDSATVHNAPPKKLSEYRVKTKLMEALDELDKTYDGPEAKESDTDEESEQYELTVDEMREQQRERARQKIRESYEIAKGRRMNKIKSKQFHRLLKKDKLKEQIKKFEEMKEKDPEEALRQLDRIEKARFQERVTLRHKNTGTWAKNLQVRAKYDTEVRRELAEQLAIGRELTARRLQQDVSSSESEGEPDLSMSKNGDANPWTERAGVHEQAVNKEKQLTSGYRQYWEERNKIENIKNQLAKEDGKSNGNHTNGEQEIEDGGSEAVESENEVPVKKAVPSGKRSKVKKSRVVMASGSWEVEDIDADEQEAKEKPVLKKKTTKKVEEKTASIEEMFEEAEELIQDVLENKLSQVQRVVDRKNFAQPRTVDRKASPTKDSSSDLSFKKRPTLADGDEQMNETTDVGAEAEKSATSSLKSALTNNTKDTNSVPAATTVASAGKATTEINLKQVVQMKPKHLLTALPNTIVSGELSEDEGEDEAHRLTIAEAFEDDDIVADFEREKQDERKKDMPQEIDDTLPGWGEWAGPGVKPRRNSRKIFKPPAELPRRDDNRDKVIINEDALRTTELSKHLVSELPFPFVTVKDYEASLRAPLGRTFIPEMAHATMVEPRVVTKLGTVIEPMKKDTLLKKPERLLRVGKRQRNEATIKYIAAVKKSDSASVPFRALYPFSLAKAGLTPSSPPPYAVAGGKSLAVGLSGTGLRSPSVEVIARSPPSTAPNSTPTV
uniref:U3 small nucleolar RNA-associated protein 14 homolog A n=1 Tax=Anopheles farauti TaxID=69004 RepID=A0A182Q1E6_9DIPT